MKTLATLAIAATFALLLAPAHASASVTDCQAQIATLSAATSATTFDRGDQGAKVQSQLLFHLEKATALLDKGDYRNALHQLNNYSKDLANGVDSGAVTAEAAAPLGTAADAIAACIAGLL